MEQEIKLLKKYNIALKNAYIKEREQKKKWKAKYESLLGDLKKNKESVQREKENSSNEEEDKKEDEKEQENRGDPKEYQKEDEKYPEKRGAPKEDQKEYENDDLKNQFLIN